MRLLSTQVYPKTATGAVPVLGLSYIALKYIYHAQLHTCDKQLRILTLGFVIIKIR